MCMSASPVLLRKKGAHSRGHLALCSHSARTKLSPNRCQSVLNYGSIKVAE